MNLGSAVTFEDSNSRGASIAYLDDTHFVIAYHDTLDGGHEGKCIAGSISGTTPTLGTAVDFEAGWPDSISIARLDDTHFVVAYADNDDSDKGKCVCGSVSGTAITMGSIVTFETGETRYIDVCGMDATHFVISFYDADATDGKCVGASVSGTTITLGSLDTFSSSTERGYKTSVCSLSSTHFVIAYAEAASPNEGKVVCGTLSGNTVSVTADSGSAFITDDEAGTISVAALSPSAFIIAFTDYDAFTYKGKVIAGTVSGTTITITSDSATLFETGPTNVNSHKSTVIAPIDSSNYYIAFVDAGDAYKGKVMRGSVSGTTITITADSATTFETGSCGSQSYYTIGLCIMGDYYGIAYTDTDDSSKSKVIIGRSQILSAAVDIDATSSVSAASYRTRGGVSNIASSAALSLVGNFYTLADAAITAVSSVEAFGGLIRHGNVSISAIARLIASWQISGICSVSSVSSLVAAGVRTASAALDVGITPSLILGGTKIADGVSEIDVACAVSVDGMRQRLGTVTISSTSAVSALGVAYFAQLMGYTGTLSAGDVLVIDCDEQTVTLNGSNATRYFTGSFPQLYSGTNELRWESDETPDASFETKHEPRYL